MLMSTSLGGGVGGGGLFNGMSTFSSSSMLGGPGMTSSSMSTRFVNGKKITTKKTMSNGIETVKVYENDNLVSHTVNGEEQLANGAGHNSSSTSAGVGGHIPTNSRHYVRSQYRRL